MEEIKWIVDQIVRGAEQNEAVVRCCGIIPSVMDIVNRKRGGLEEDHFKYIFLRNKTKCKNRAEI